MNAQVADELDIEVRFIELMPMNHEVEEVSLYRITGKVGLISEGIIEMGHDSESPLTC